MYFCGWVSGAPDVHGSGISPSTPGAWVAASVWLRGVEGRWSSMWSGQQLPLFGFALPSVFPLVLVAGDTSFRDVSFVIDCIFIYLFFFCSTGDGSQSLMHALSH